MKKFLFSFLLILTVFLVIGCGTTGNQSASGTGNKIVIYTSMYEYVIESLKQNLHRQFPQYNVEFFYGGTGTLQNRVASEQASGRLGCDILMVAEPAYSLELKQKGMLHAFRSRESANLAFEYDRDGYWYPMRVSNMILAYNPAINTKDSIPNSFYDFAHDPKVKGKISMRSPLTSGTSMAAVTALRDKYGYEYFEALSKQNISIEYGSDTPLSKLETGEYSVVMILEESILRRRQEGSKLEVIYPTDGTVMIPSSIMIINDKWSANRNTGTAEVITDWFLSTEGQNAIVDGWMHSVRTNFGKLPYDAKATSEIRASSIAVNWENYFNQRKEIQDRFQEYLANRNMN